MKNDCTMLARHRNYVYSHADKEIVKIIDLLLKGDMNFLFITASNESKWLRMELNDIEQRIKADTSISTRTATQKDGSQDNRAAKSKLNLSVNGKTTQNNVVLGTSTTNTDAVSTGRIKTNVPRGTIIEFFVTEK